MCAIQVTESAAGQNPRYTGTETENLTAKAVKIVTAKILHLLTSVNSSENMRVFILLRESTLSAVEGGEAWRYHFEDSDR